MTDVLKTKNDPNTQTINPIAAGIAGAVMGGVAVATAMVMSDKNNQKKVQKALTTAKEKVMDLKGNVEEKIDEGKEKATKIADVIKTATKDTISAAK